MHAANENLVHNVYFALKDATPANRAHLVAACHRLLKPIPGIVYFGCGTLAPELDREVNVRDWDVGLHVVFTDQAAHDAYQDHPMHVQFVEENKASWSGVRVFDSVAHAG